MVWEQQVAEGQANDTGQPVSPRGRGIGADWGRGVGCTRRGLSGEAAWPVWGGRGGPACSEDSPRWGPPGCLQVNWSQLLSLLNNHKVLQPQRLSLAGWGQSLQGAGGAAEVHFVSSIHWPQPLEEVSQQTTGELTASVGPVQGAQGSSLGSQVAVQLPWFLAATHRHPPCQNWQGG